MVNFQDIINLAKVDGGKFFVIDEQGEAKLVIMSVGDYQKLLLGKLQRQVEDIEEINQEIIKAQMVEPDIETLIPKLKSRKAPAIPRVDMRQEVIDPSFDFEGPKIDFEDF